MTAWCQGTKPDLHVNLLQEHFVPIEAGIYFHWCLHSSLPSFCPLSNGSCQQEPWSLFWASLYLTGPIYGVFSVAGYLPALQLLVIRTVHLAALIALADTDLR